MYTRKLMKIKLEFKGHSIDTTLDRLHTARIIESLEGKFIIEAEVYGKGIRMWLLSKGKNIRVISSVELCDEILNEIDQIKRFYEITYNSN